MRSRTKAVTWSGHLLLFLWTCASGQESCAVEKTRPELQTPNETQSQLTLNSAFMTPMVHSFLGLVQPNPFPKDLLVRMINNFDSITQAEMVKEVLNYEKGFLVGVAIGILYIVLMPLIGLIFACCRCCGNCGGRMQQKQTSSTNCKRRSIYCSTFIITVLILAGNICMFLSTTYTSETMKSSSKEVTGILDDVKGYISSIPQEIQQVLDESSVIVDQVKNNLNETGPLLGGSIQNSLKDSLDPAFNSITQIAQVINSTSAEVLHVNETLKQLKPKIDTLKTRFSAVRQRINNTMHQPECMNCSSLQQIVDKLSLEGSLEFSDQNDLSSTIDKARNADVLTQANKGRDFFDSIPQKVKNGTQESVKSALTQLDGIKTQISGVSKKLPLDFLKTITDEITSVQRSVSVYSPEVEKASLISRAIGLILSCLILLVVVCNFLGLLLGAAGLNPKKNPTDRSGTSNCGGIFFMVGVGFSFLISWIFMLVVLILFIVVGNTYTLVCVPWQSKQLIQVIDTPGLIPGFNLSETLNMNINLNFYDIYSDCEQNSPVWTTLHLNELFDLNNILNVSMYTKEFYQSFEAVQINIANITILSSDIKSQLNDFSKSASTMNFSNIIQHINDVSGTNLSSAADSLDLLAGKQSNQNISNQLQGEVKDLRDIQAEITSNIMPLLLELNSTINNLSTVASQINASVQNALLNVGYAQDILNYNISQIVRAESKVFVGCQMKIFLAYTEWANQTITGRIGRCRPAAAAIDRTENLLCKHLVGSLNAFWFSLGWCMLFLIPSIILSVKLAKYYYRMKYSDVYENNNINNITMHPFPKANLKPEFVENVKQQ